MIHQYKSDFFIFHHFFLLNLIFDSLNIDCDLLVIYLQAQVGNVVAVLVKQEAVNVNLSIKKINFIIHQQPDPHENRDPIQWGIINFQFLLKF